MNTTPQPDTLTAALAWHAAGASVVRVATDGTKRPLGGWKEYQQQRATEQQLHAWFTNGHPGVGLVLGEVSGHLEMLEFEGRAVTEGLTREFGEICQASGLGDLWDTIKRGYCERTPLGGYHLIYRVLDGPVLPNTKLASRPSTPAELEAEPNAKQKVLIETRGEGGFVVVAPSHGPVHPTGQPWELLAGSPATVAEITADERDALFAIARMLDQMPQAPQPTTPAGPAETFLLGGHTPGDDAGLKPGDDFEQRTSWTDILKPHGWQLLHTSGHTSYWRRPGKATGVSATTGRDPQRDRLYVFSTSTEFEAERPYTKFGAYALLEHGGDHSAAARELRRRGYGQAPEQTRHLAAVPAPTSPAPAAIPATDGTAALQIHEQTPQPHRADIDITYEPEAIIAITDSVRAGALPDIYVRGGDLVQVAEVSGDVLRDEPSGLAHAIRPVSPDGLRRLLARHANVYRMKAGRKDDEPRPVPASPTVAVCKAVLTESAWPGLPALAGLAGAPVLRPDGSILQTPGYDPATCLYYAPTTPVPAIPDQPSAADIARALDFVLGDVLGDFPWATDADRANYLALLVSPILRPYVGGLLPLGAISATDRGSGKTLLADVIGTLYGATVRPWVSDDDELRKSITAALMTSNAVITLDNVGARDSVEAPSLAKLLTSPTWDDRVLGRSEQATLTNDRLWLVTGNNIRFGGDIAQRTVLVRLDPRCPRPDLRTGFRIPDLDEWLENPDHRARLLHSLLVLVRSWIVAGAPRGEYAMRSFRRWARALGGFLAHHQVDGFLTNADELEEQDEEASTWAGFLAAWYQRFGSTPKTAGELRTSAAVGDHDAWGGTFLTRPDGSLPTPRGLGMMLASHRGRYFGDYVLRGEYDRKAKTWHYRVERDAAVDQLPGSEA